MLVFLSGYVTAVIVVRKSPTKSIGRLSRDHKVSKEKAVVWSSLYIPDYEMVISRC